MTYRWNPGPDDPRPDDAAPGDPDLPYRYTGPADTGPADTGQADTGQADTDQADTDQADDGAAEPDGDAGPTRDHAPGFTAASGDHEPQGRTGAWPGAGAGGGGGAQAPGGVSASQWQPGYEPFGHRQAAHRQWGPGQAGVERAGPGRPSVERASVAWPGVEPAEAPADKHALYRRPGNQSAGGATTHRQPDYEPSRYQEQQPAEPHAWQQAEPSRGAWPAGGSPSQEAEADLWTGGESTDLGHRNEPEHPWAFHYPQHDAPAWRPEDDGLSGQPEDDGLSGRPEYEPRAWQPQHDVPVWQPEGGGLSGQPEDAGSAGRPGYEPPAWQPELGGRAGQTAYDPAVWRPEQDVSDRQSVHDVVDRQREPDPTVHGQHAQLPVVPDGSAYGDQIASGVTGTYGQPDDYRPYRYQPPDLPVADVVSYGFNGDRAAAADPQRGGPSVIDSGPAHNGWTGQPDPDQPEFVLQAPVGSGPFALVSAAPAGPGAPPGSAPAAAGQPGSVFPYDDVPRRGLRASRGRSRRGVWLGLAGLLVVVVAAAAVLTGGLGPSSHVTHQPPAAPAHALATPQKIGTYGRDQQAEQQLGLSHGEQYVTQIDPGHVSGIVAAVYDIGGPASSPDRVAVIAGRLANSPLADVIKSFTQQETAEGNAPVTVAAGSLGGLAACAGRGASGICVWADHDTVGVLVSATINASSLVRVMLTIRPAVEVPSA